MPQGIANEYQVGTTRLTTKHENNAYLEIDLNYPKNLRDLFPIQFLPFTLLPEELSDNGADPNWSEVEVMGRYAPYQVYGGTSSNEISFVLHFYAFEDVINDVKQKVDWLRAMKYPVLYQNISYRPPSLRFVWGSFMNKSVILKSAQPAYRAPWHIDASDTVVNNYTLLPLHAEVAVSLVVVEEDFISGPDVMRGLY